MVGKHPGWNAQSKEVVAVTALAAARLPLFPFAPTFVATVMYSAWDSYRKHRRAHLDPVWARRHLPWHYDHHMGPDPECNWCVTRPWFDYLMGTRRRDVGSSQERAPKPYSRK